MSGCSETLEQIITGAHPLCLLLWSMCYLFDSQSDRIPFLNAVFGVFGHIATQDEVYTTRLERKRWGGGGGGGGGGEEEKRSRNGNKVNMS